MSEKFFKNITKLARVICPILSILFTGKLVIELVGTESWDRWVIIILISIILNMLELRAFYIWRKTDSWNYLALGVLIAVASVFGSLGYLQVSYERAVMQSNEYKLKLDEIGVLKTQIKSLQETAEKQRQINHITKSQETLLKMTPLMNKLGMIQKDLDNIKESGSGLGGALYRVFTKIFGIPNFWVAVLVNLFFAIIIEIGAIESNIKDIIQDGIVPQVISQVDASKKNIKEQIKGKQGASASPKTPQAIGAPVPNIACNVAMKDAIKAMLEAQEKKGKVNKTAIARQMQAIYGNCSRQYVQQVDDERKKKQIGFGVKRDDINL